MEGGRYHPHLSQHVLGNPTGGRREADNLAGRPSLLFSSVPFKGPSSSFILACREKGNSSFRRGCWPRLALSNLIQLLLTSGWENSLDLWTVEFSWGAGTDEPVLMSCPFPRQQADPKERYAISELLTDLENCNARRVLLFLDQSYPGPLVKKLQASQRHPNVVLVHSTTALRSGSAFAEFWAGLQPDQCLLQHTLPVSV